MNCILVCYHNINQEEKSNFNLDDKRIIIDILQKEIPETYFRMAYSIPAILYLDYKDSLKQLKLFLSKCSNRDIEHVIYVLDYSHKLYEKLDLIDVVLNSTIVFEINYAVEKILKKLVIKSTNGTQTVLQYLKKRIEYWEQLYNDKTHYGYHVVPMHARAFFEVDYDNSILKEILNTIFNWFNNEELDYWKNNILVAIIHYISPSSHIHQKLYDVFNDLISNAKSFNHILNLTTSLKAYNKKNSLYVDLIVKIFKHSVTLSLSSEQEDKLKKQGYISLTTLGVKSGTPGQPFSVDLELMELMKESIQKYKNGPPQITELFNATLRSTEECIQDSYRENDEVW